MNDPILQAYAVTKKYPRAKKTAVDTVDLAIGTGEFLSILGRSGSGKTTLLNILSSLILPDSGQIFFNDKNICDCSEKERNQLRKSEFAVVFQQHHLMPYLSALENVLLPFMSGFTPATAEQCKTAQNMLMRVGLAGKEMSIPGKLSGGEQQRVAIARALAKGSRILFADEPTGNLDSATGASVMQLLHSLNKDGMTIVMVTHNPEYAQQTHRTITMADGRIIEA